MQNLSPIGLLYLLLSHATINKTFFITKLSTKLKFFHECKNEGLTQTTDLIYSDYEECSISAKVIVQ